MRPLHLMAALAIAVLSLLFVFRYDLQVLSSESGARAYLLDRWTGSVKLIDVDSWTSVDRSK